MIDATIIRSHQHFVGAKWGKKNQALERRCGGFSTKIHAAWDALGNPMRFILTPGQSSDDTQAEALIDSFDARAILADKGYDADYIIEKTERKELEIRYRDCHLTFKSLGFRYDAKHCKRVKTRSPSSSHRINRNSSQYSGQIFS